MPPDAKGLARLPGRNEACGGGTKIASETISALLVILAAGLISLYPLWLHRGIIYSPHSDIVSQHLSIKAVGTRAVVEEHTLPFWNPAMNAGQPAFANPESSYAFPFDFLYLVAPIDIAINCVILLNFLLAGLSMYLFSRRWFSRAPSLFCAMAYMLSYRYVVTIQAGWLPKMSMYALVPLLFWSCEMLLQAQTARRLCLFAAVFGLSLVQGDMQQLYYAALGLAVYVFVRLVFFLRTDRIRAALHLLGGGVVGVLLAAPVLCPRMEYAFLSTRAYSNYAFFLQSPPTLSDLKTLLDPCDAGGNREGFWEKNFYFGLWWFPFLPFAFRNQWRQAALLLAAITILIVLCFDSPMLRFAYHFVPGFQVFRQSPRLLFLAQFLAVLLGGMGAENLLRATPQARRSYFLSASAFLMLGACLLAARTTGADLTLLISSLVVFFLLLLFVQARVRIGAVVCLCVLPVLDSVARTWPMLSVLPLARVAPHHPLHDLLNRQHGRIVATEPDLLPYGMAGYFGVDTLNGYTSMNLKHFVEYFSILQYGSRQAIPHEPVVWTDFRQLAKPEMLRALDVRYILCNEARGLERVGYERDARFTNVPTFFFGKGVKPRVVQVWRARDPLGPAYFATSVHGVKDASESLDAVVAAPSVLDAYVTALDRDVTPMSFAGGMVKQVYRGYNRYEYQIESKEGNFLILSQIWYPGWTATVDGSKTKVYRTNHALIGCFIPAGQHHLVLEMTSASFMYGIIAAGGVLLIIVIVWVLKRKLEPASAVLRFSVAAAICLGGGVLWHAFCHRATLFWDFRLCYAAASLLRHGQNPYDNSLLFTATGSYGFPFAYPLPIAYLFWPFTFLPYSLAAMMWLGLTTILWGLLVVLWWRQFNGGRPHPLFPLLALLVFNLALPKNILTGNVATVEAVLLWTAFVFLVKKNLPAFVAFLLAAAAFKMTPLLFLGLPLLHPQLRRWKPLAWGGVLFALYMAASYALAPGWFKDYQVNVSFNVQQWAFKDLINPSTYALSRRLVFTFLPSLPANSRLLCSGLLYGLLIAPVVLISWKVARVLAGRNWAEVGPTAILYATLVYGLIMPRFSDYSYTLVIPAALYAAGTILPPSRSVFLIASLLLPVPFISFPHDPLFLGDFSLGRLGLWSLLMVVVCWGLFSRHLLLQARRQAQPGNAAARAPVRDDKEETKPRGRSVGWSVLVCALLALVTVGLYWPVSRYGLISLDDPEYITWNPQIRDGFTVPAINWAFTTGYTGNWHPLTWLSYMLDYQLHGGSPGGMHLTNLLLHVTNALLLFLLFRRMTGAVWRSAFVAAVFALHPLHVESVAWVAERKDVLSTFFGLLAIWAYVCHTGKSQVQSPKPKVAGGPATQHATGLTFHVSLFYLLSLLLFACSLMSKAMLVTLPFVLLLLDYWPLNRFQKTQAPHRTAPSILRPSSFILFEKLPFLALSLAFSLITFRAQHTGGAVVPTSLLPLDARLANALMSYLYYLRNALWPAYLSAASPPQQWLPWQPLLAATILAGLTVLLLWKWKQPCLRTGWFWFLGTLVPVIGIVQVGSQTMADRFMYFPLIGLSICLAWGAFDLATEVSKPAASRVPKAAALSMLGLFGLLSLIACAGVTRQQVSYWKDSLSLFGRALTVTSKNLTAHNLYGLALEADNRTPEAIEHYREALRINPASPGTHVNLGSALGSQGNLEGAISHNLKALEITPDNPEAHDNVGVALLMQGKPGDAAAHFSDAVRLRPSFAQARSHWAYALQQEGKLDDAILQLREALRYAPAASGIHLQLSSILAQKGLLDEAMAESSTALRLKPDDLAAHDNLADLLVRQGESLARRGKFDQAKADYQAALDLKPDSPEAHSQLGAILAEAKDMSGALAHWRQALRLKPDWLELMNNLAWALASYPDPKIRNGAEAVQLAERACALSGSNSPPYLDTLAAAYAETGRFADAAAALEKAIALAQAASDTNAAAKFRTRLELYQAQRPYREH